MVVVGCSYLTQMSEFLLERNHLQSVGRELTDEIMSILLFIHRCLMYMQWTTCR